MSSPTDPSSPPPGLWGQVKDFANNMDSRAWRALAIALAMVVVAAAVLVVGRLYYGDQVEALVKGAFGEARRTYLGLPVTILVFTLTAYVGAPQFILIAACTVAFGPEVGFWYAWAATIVSGVVTYFTGRLVGVHTRKRLSGATGGRFTRFMGKNTFLASLVVRNLPTAPFIVVNTAFGAARANFWAYIAGLALGVLPKTAIIAFAGDGIMDAIEGNIGSAALAGGVAIVLWLLVTLVIRRWVRRPDGAKDNAAE
jgi:uncharacterized membrane protein YdjX (TVP38/TMEM64 family)